MELIRVLTENGVIIPIVGMIFAFGIIAIAQWRKYRQADLELPLKMQTLALKQQMVESGMSASEIERVLKAQQPDVSNASRSCPPALARND